MRLKLFVIMLVVFALAFSVTGIAAQDGPTLGILGNGDSFNDALTGNITAVLYGFNAVANDTVIIDMVPAENSKIDPYMVVLGPYGEFIASNDDGGDVPLASRITLKVPADSSYFIIASSYGFINGTSNIDVLKEDMPYTISISGNTLPAGMTRETETVQFFRSILDANVPFTDGYSSQAEPVYYFRYDIAAPTTVDVTAVSPNMDSLVHVFDINGFRIAVNDNAGAALPSQFDAGVFGLNLPDPGSYLIFVTQKSFANLDVKDFTDGTFTVTVNN